MGDRGQGTEMKTIYQNMLVGTMGGTFKNLLAWQKAHVFVLSTYRLTETFPSHERYGIISQWRRAAVSVPSNIAEGYAKATTADCLRYLDIAKGSLAECEYYVILTQELGYLSLEQAQQIEAQRQESARLLMGLMRALRKKQPA